MLSKQSGCSVGHRPGIDRVCSGRVQLGFVRGNSNWREPVWLPTNYTLILALEKFHRFLGEDYTVLAPGLAESKLTLHEVVDWLAVRMTNLYRPDAAGRLPAFPPDSPWQSDPHWREHLQFFEYFHGDNGLGLGASH